MHKGIRVIKLTSGDTIVAKLTRNDASPYVQIQDPIQFTLVHKSDNEGNLVASAWLETEETSFSLHKMQIVADAEPNQMLKSYYTYSLEEVHHELSDIEEEFFNDFEINTIH